MQAPINQKRVDNPEYAEAYYKKGISLLCIDDYTAAIKEFDKAIELNPQYAEAYYRKGVSLLDLGKREEAIKEYDKAIEIEPQHAGAQCLRIKCSNYTDEGHRQVK